MIKTEAHPKDSVVREYNIAHQEGECLSFGFSDDFSRLCEIINDKDNGIPDNIRAELAQIYRDAGESLECTRIHSRTSFSDLETHLEDLVSCKYGEEYYNAVLRAVDIENEAVATEIIEEVQEKVCGSVQAKALTDFISDTVTIVLYKRIQQKVQEGLLPELENGGNDFDLG